MPEVNMRNMYTLQQQAGSTVRQAALAALMKLCANTQDKYFKCHLKAQRNCCKNEKRKVFC